MHPCHEGSHSQASPGLKVHMENFQDQAKPSSLHLTQSHAEKPLLKALLHDVSPCKAIPSPLPHSSSLCIVTAQQFSVTASLKENVPSHISFPATTLFPSYLPLFPASLHSCGLWSFLGGWDKQNCLYVTPSLMAKMPSELCFSQGGQGAAQPHPSCVHLLRGANEGRMGMAANHN